MKKFFQTTAMSLTELLVATVLVGIVMVGVVSVDYAVRSTKQTASQGGLLSMQTSATILRVSKEIEKAVGDNSNPPTSHGINVASGPLCIRLDDDGTPGDYTDDEWSCYELSGSTNIARCIKNAELAEVPGTCNGDADREVIGTATSFTYSFTLDEVAQDIYVDVALTNRADVTKSFHAINNPEYTITTRVHPASHGY